MEGSAPTALLKKLHEVATAIPFAQKRGEHAQGYKYVQAVDVVADVRDKLLERGVIVVPSAGGARHEEARGGRGFITTIDLLYRFTDVETGEYVEVPWTAVGNDIGGDKGIYKAMTGGLKYALLTLFLIPTSDDPERDQLTDAAPEPEAKVERDAERPAAPTIPSDRAYVIAERAQNLGYIKLVVPEGGGVPTGAEFEPVFKAMLSATGVEKIGELNVDQAEDVEAWLTAEEAEAEGAAAEEASA